MKKHQPETRAVERLLTPSAATRAYGDDRMASLRAALDISANAEARAASSSDAVCGSFMARRPQAGFEPLEPHSDLRALFPAEPGRPPAEPGFFARLWPMVKKLRFSKESLSEGLKISAKRAGASLRALPARTWVLIKRIFIYTPPSRPLALVRMPFSCRKPDGLDALLRLGPASETAGIWLNGAKLADRSDPFSRLEWRVGDLIEDGDNLLALAFEYKKTGAIGVFGAAELVEVPKSRIIDVAARAETEGDSGFFSADVSVVAGDLEMAKGGKLRLRVFSGAKKLAESEAAVGPFTVRSHDTVSVGADLRGAARWNPGSPALMTACVSLYRGDGSLCETRAFEFGLRDISLMGYDKKKQTGPALLLNGDPLTLRGALITSAAALLEEDLPRRLAAAGFNAAYVCGVGAPDSFLSACDAAGVLVMCDIKTPLGRLARSHEPLRKAVARAASAVAAARNHPSVFAWSLGFRELVGSGLLRALAKSIDPTRPVCCEGDFGFDVSDFFAASDCSLGEMRRFAQKRWLRSDENPWDLRHMISPRSYRNLPLLLTAMSPAGAEDKFALARKFPQLAGGFVEYGGLPPFDTGERP